MDPLMNNRLYASAELSRPAYEHNKSSLYMSDAGLYGLQESGWLPMPAAGSYEKAALSLHLPPAPPPPPPLEDDALPGGMLRAMSVPIALAREGGNYRVSDPLLLNPFSAYQATPEESGTPYIPDMYAISDEMPPSEIVTNGNEDVPRRKDAYEMDNELSKTQSDRLGGDLVTERYACIE